MRGNAFGMIENDWITMSTPQWREFIGRHGQLSQKQQRKLTEQLPYLTPLQPANTKKKLLVRVMVELSELSADERMKWWQSIKYQPCAIHVALSKGLSFKDVDKSVVHEVLEYNLRHHTAVAAKIWDHCISSDMRHPIMHKVIDAWLQGDKKLFEKNWGPRLDALMATSDHDARMEAVACILGYAYELVYSGYDIDPASRDLMTSMILRCAPPHLQILTKLSENVSDIGNMLPPLLSEEENYALTTATPSAVCRRGHPRL